MTDGQTLNVFVPEAPSFLPAEFLKSFVAEIFSTPERVANASALIGAPLALACLDSLGGDAFERAGIERDTLLRQA